MDAFARELANTFIDAVAKFELDPRTDSIETSEVVRYTHFPNGRAGTSVTHEIFLFDPSPNHALSQSHAIAADSPHLITLFGDRVRNDTPVDGAPASFGRMVMFGDRSYLGEIMTFPP